MEGATPPVVDGHVALFNGTGGASLRSAGAGLITDSLSAADNLSDVAVPATAFANIVQAAAEDALGGVEKATDAEIRSAAAGALAICAEDLESAAALVTLTDAATIDIDWDTFINAEVILAGNRAFGAPTNVQIGTTRSIFVTTDGTVREASFHANYLGANDTITDLDSDPDTRALITMVGLTSTTAIITGVARY
jgi:hypothetical protein